MQWSDIQFNPSTRTLRQFAGLLLVVFGALALVEWLVRDRPQLALVYAAVSLMLGPLGLLQPAAMRPIWVVWSVVAFPIGWMVSQLVLGLLFFGVFTPIGLLFRAAGRDPLALRRPVAGSYWRPKPAARDKRQYFRQS
jgi:hypothetical protein